MPARGATPAGFSYRSHGKDKAIMAILREKFKGRWRYRWQAYYTDPAGKKRRKSSKWFSSKAECEESLQAFQADPKKETRRRLKFSTVHEEWVEFTGKANTKKTRKDKETSIQIYFSDLMNMNIFDITPNTIREEMGLPEFEKLGTKRKNKIHGYLKSLFTFAEDFHDLPRNPMRVIPTFKATAEEQLKEVEILDPEDFKELVQAVAPEHEVYARLFSFLYWTGMRLNEAASLTFADITENKVNVWRQWKKDEGFVPLKTKGSARVVTVDADLMQIVADQRALYSEFPHFSEDWFIFGGPRHLAYSTIERVKNRACDAAELPRVKIHSFRHSHASNLIHAGVPIFQISKRLGHSSVSMTTDIYGHLIDRSEDEIMSAIAHAKKKSHIFHT